MGGRGSRGGGIAPGDNTTTTGSRASGAGLQTGGGNASGGGGGGGGSSSGASKGSGGASTGGIQTGGGNGQGGGGPVIDNTTTNKQVIPPDADLDALFEDSEIFDELISKFPGDAEFKRNRPRYYQRWLDSVELQQQVDNDTSLIDSPEDPVEVTFADNTPEDKVDEILQEMEEMPERIRRVLQERGLEIHAGRRADDTSGWDRYTQVTGRTSDDQVADGRSIGSLSFFSPTTNQVFISTDSPGGSANVMVHEMSHALDFTLLRGKPIKVESAPGVEVTVERISRDDPEWVKMHDDYLLPAKGVDEWFDYFVGGPSGSDDAAGRAELFAEGLAAYLHGPPSGGKLRLRQFLFNGLKDTTARFQVADKMIEIWKRYGIIE